MNLATDNPTVKYTSATVTLITIDMYIMTGGTRNSYTMALRAVQVLLPEPEGEGN